MKKLISVLTFLTCSIALAKFAPSSEKNFSLDTDKSLIQWSGEKEVLFSADCKAEPKKCKDQEAGNRHNGTVALQSGFLNTKDGKINGGQIVVDMTSIKNLDVKAEKWRKKLEGHLMSEDFFASGIEANKTALFKIQKVDFVKKNSYKITGDMTIRSTTKKNVSFVAEIIKTANLFTTNGTLVLNRTDFGVSYNSKANFLKKLISVPLDKVIKDNFTLTFKLSATPTATIKN